VEITAEMLWSLLTTVLGVSLGVVLADYFLIRREVRKAVRVLMGMPEVRRLKRSFSGFSKLAEEIDARKVNEIIDTVHRFVVGGPKPARKRVRTLEEKDK